MRTNGDPSKTSPTVPRPVERIGVQEAAHLLGTTVDGIRSRIKCGTLDSMKVDGTVYVLLGPDQTPPGPGWSWIGAASSDQPRPDPTGQDGEVLLAAKDETIQHLRRELDARNEELRRKETIIMTLAQRVPELEEAPQGGQEAAQEPPRGAGRVLQQRPAAAPAAQTGAQRPW